jgi:hypothetical protein
VIGLVNVPTRPKGQSIVDSLGASINLGAMIAIKGSSLAVAFDNVLMQFGPNHLKDIAQVAQDGKVAPNGVGGLLHVPEAHVPVGGCEGPQQGRRHVAHELLRQSIPGGRSHQGKQGDRA